LVAVADGAVSVKEVASTAAEVEAQKAHWATAS
jgi:hypothetical protein